jgi:hypothetical protein
VPEIRARKDMLVRRRRCGVVCMEYLQSKL